MHKIIIFYKLMLNQISNELYDFVGKIVVIGESNVGKSNILTRYCKNEFEKETKMTIGVEFFTKIVTIQGKTLKFQIWDTAGQERYKSITNNYFLNTTAAIIVFDLTNKQSLDKVDFWMTEVKKHTKEDLIVLLVGNKSDLNCQISDEEIKNKALNHKIDYVETSALLNKNINEAFEKIIQKVYGLNPQLRDDQSVEFEFKDSFALKKSFKTEKPKENTKYCC